MIAAALAAAIAAVGPAGPDFAHPDAYVGEDGCRYVRKAVPKAPPRRVIVVQLRPVAAIAPPLAASAPARPKRRASLIRPKREEVPGYVREECDEGAPPSPLETILPPSPPFTPAPYEPEAPLPAGPGPELSPPVRVPELPASPGMEEPAPAPEGPPAWAGPGAFPGPALIFTGPVFVPVLPSIPEPRVTYLLLAGFLALACLRRRA